MQKNSFDAEKILAQSTLRNKTFTAEVKEIEVNGIKAYMMEEHSNPIVSLSFKFKNAGYAHDKNGKFGLANIASDLIMEGAGKYNEQELKDLMEENGIKIGFGTGRDDFFGSMVAPKENLKTAVLLLKQIMYYPVLPEDQLEIIKTQNLKSLDLQYENPNSELSIRAAEKLYKEHPYARNPIGKKEDISALSADDIREYLKNTFIKQNLIIGLSGDVTGEEGLQILDDIFAALPAENNGNSLEKFEYQSTGDEFNIKRDIPQVIATFSAKGVYREDKDFYPLYLANYILGESGLTSRLNKVIREENGLTYGIYTTLTYSDAAALIRGGFSADYANYEKAKELLLEEWRKMAQNGISAEELEKTKKSLIDSFNLRFADISVVSDILLAMQEYNLGIDFLQKRNDYIKNITLTEVNEAAASYFGTAPDFVTIGKERKRD
ncbi:MAG: insulinase family protein [Alphaproteobacteria bacterium]|nr:insulinase family protein [Alphaproteobacteria bacterium]